MPVRPFAFAALFCLGFVAAPHAQWEALHPGGGGQIQDIELDPSTPGRLYSLSDVDGFYRSDDYGLSYRSLNEGLHTDAVSTLEVDPSDPDRLFLGTARGVLRSTDGGESWMPMGGSEAVVGGDNGDQLGIHVSTLAIDPVEPEHVYFANSWGWKSTYTFYWGPFGYNLTSDIIHPGQVYVTADGGETWDIVTFEPNTSYMDVYSIEVNPAANNEVYLAAHPGVYKSTDYGQTWAKLPTPAGAFLLARRGRDAGRSVPHRHVHHGSAAGLRRRPDAHPGPRQQRSEPEHLHLYRGRPERRGGFVDRARP